VPIGGAGGAGGAGVAGDAGGAGTLRHAACQCGWLSVKVEM